MNHPSIEHLLRHRGFGFEADRIADLVLAIEAMDALDAVTWRGQDYTLTGGGRMVVKPQPAAAGRRA